MNSIFKNFYDKANNLRAQAEIIGDKVWVKWFEIGKQDSLDNLDKHDYMNLYIRVADYCDDNELTLWSY